MSRTSSGNNLGLGEMLVSLVGLAASVIPFLAYSDPVWGVRSFADKELFGSSTEPGIIVLQVDSDSPAAFAGIQEKDRIITVNARPVTVDTFREILRQIQSGETMILEGQRAGEPLHLEFQGQPRALEGVLFLDWQIISAPIFLSLILLLIATGPLEPRPLWRAIVVTLGGLAVLVTAVVVEAVHQNSWTRVWQTRPIAHTPTPSLHYSVAAVGAMAGLVLAVLGAFDIRAVLARRSKEPVA